MQVAILGPLEVRDDDGDGRARSPAPGCGPCSCGWLSMPAARSRRPSLVDAVWGDQPPGRRGQRAADAGVAAAPGARRRRRGDPVAGRLPARRRSPRPSTRTGSTRLADDGRARPARRRRRDARRSCCARRWRCGAARRWPTRWTSLAGAGAPGCDELRLAAVRRPDRRRHRARRRRRSSSPELEALAGDFPLDERIARQLVTALAGAGRQADALRAYERVRDRLADELGVDPSAELQAVHWRVLRGELATAATRPARGGRTCKAQLTSFVGRDDEVARIGKALRGEPAGHPGRARRGRQDPAGQRGGRAARRRVPTGSGWSSSRRSPTAPTSRRRCSARSGCARSTCSTGRPSSRARDAESRLLDVLGRQDGRARARQLRAPASTRSAPAGRAPARRSARTCASWRPAASRWASSARSLLAVPPLGQPAPDAPAGRGAGVPGRAAVRRPGRGGRARSSRSTTATVADGHRDRPAPGRPAAGDRAGRRPAAHAAAGRDRGPARPTGSGC